MGVEETSISDIVVWKKPDEDDFRLVVSPSSGELDTNAVALCLCASQVANLLLKNYQNTTDESSLANFVTDLQRVLQEDRSGSLTKVSSYVN